MEQCQKCKEVGEDRRTLRMSCFYAMEELNLPFVINRLSVVDSEEFMKSQKVITNDMNFYTLRVCKDCRADWMTAIQTWFNDQPEKKESCGSGIFIRKNGATIEVTEEEFRQFAPGVIPTRLLREDEC